MPSLKDVKLQITGVRKTKQITKAMSMVASAKLRGSQTRIERFRPYAHKFREIITRVIYNSDYSSFPLAIPHENPSQAIIILLTSDRGLCGGFNANLIATALSLAKEKTDNGFTVKFICIGKKGRDAVRKSPYTLLESYTEVSGKIDFYFSYAICNKLQKMYENNEVDEVYTIYSEFGGPARQITHTDGMLPLTINIDDSHNEPDSTDYLYEPDADKLVDFFLPIALTSQLLRDALDNIASENAARMSAMDNATRNCDELTNSLTLLYNKTRQATITNELIDIVGGANAQQSR